MNIVAEEHYTYISRHVTAIIALHVPYRGADKSLARPGRKQAAPVRSVMDRGMN